MKNPGLFFGGIAVLVVGIALGIFFLIPGVPHIITDSASHTKHAIACFVLGILGLVVALVNRPNTAEYKILGCAVCWVDSTHSAFHG